MTRKHLMAAGATLLALAATAALLTRCGSPSPPSTPTYGSAHRYDTDLYASTGLLHAIYDHADPDGDGDRAGGDGDAERAADAGADDGGADLRRDADEAAGRYGDADRHRPGHRA
jgi:hypothetical protein